MMSTVSSNERKRIHPHKFILWIAMGSIVMMFAGLTSAYIVRRSQENWLGFSMPGIFWYSTLVILTSSVTIHLSLKSFRERAMIRYRILITVTALLGLLFSALQFSGFSYLNDHGVSLFGEGSNPSASFLGVIAGLHVLHVLGGVIALLVITLRSYSLRKKTYSPVSLEMVCAYWHFVDILWLYLFIFLKWV